MADRDIPSVPVTTLAGLASLSDLLSELPISESSITTSLNKSLLFHPRVAEEANNLLSIKDDNLTRQLVQAIEQTNSDHIELKSQYAEQPSSGTNINELPQLLQAIHTLKPTVFKSGSQQQQRQIFQPHLLLRNVPQQTVVVQQNQYSAGGSNNQIWNPQTYQAAGPQTYGIPNQQQQQTVIQQQSQPHYQQTFESEPQNFSQSQQQQHGFSHAIGGSTVVVGQYQQKFQGMPMPIKNEVIIKEEFQSTAPMNFSQVPQQKVQSPMQSPVIQQTMTATINQQVQGAMPATVLQTVPTNQNLMHQNMQNASQPLVHHSTQVVLQPQQQFSPQQPVLNQQVPIAQHSPSSKTKSYQQHSIQQSVLQQRPQQQSYQQPINQQQQSHQQPQSHSLQPHAQQTSPLPSHQQQTHPQQLAHPSQYQQPVQQHIIQNQVNQQLSGQQIQQEVSNQTNAHSSQQLQLKPLATNAVQKMPSNISPSNRMNTPNQAQKSSVGGVIDSTNQTHLQQKMVPRNSEYLEKLNKNTDGRGGPSPAQASDAPESNQTTIQQRTANPSTSLQIINNIKGQPPPSSQLPSSGQMLTNPNQKVTSNPIQINSTTSAVAAKGNNRSKVARIKLRRLKLNEINMMEESLSEFSKNSPALAQTMGLIKKPDVPDTADVFTKIKALEKRGLKRPNHTNENADEKIQFVQPKLRRIMLKSSKSSKEDITKSQTYQQFMKNMEHELRRLEETEQPSNIDDLDYSDCIPSKVLAQLSNDVAKLKAKGALDEMPKNKLTLLINFAMRNVDVARNFSVGPDMEDDIDDFIDKILDAAEACLLVTNIYATASDVKFLQEDNMDKIVKFAQLQMRGTIFPSYDPVFNIGKNKKDNRKKKNSGGGGSGGISRGVQLLFTKLVELTKIFVTLFDNCSFVDTIVLSVATLAVEPFFVDNIETLQFAALELVTTIFRKENYSSYQSSILSDILASIDRLPHSKKNLRPYKLANNGGSIQMITALVLQLVQCSTVLSESLTARNAKNNKRKSATAVDTDLRIGSDLVILEKCDTAFNVGGNVLTVFLNKCKSRSSETDFRPLFENFIHDLLTTVNKPEWPASELLLSLLGTLLVKYMSDKSVEQSIRVVSLEYLGIVAARLRKDTVESRCKVNTMDALIKCIKLEQEKEGEKDGTESKFIVDPEEERTEFLQKILLDFLAVNAQEDNLVWDYARYYYLCHWYKEIIQRKKSIAEGEKGYASRKMSPKKRRKFKADSDDDDDDDNDDDSSDDDDKKKSNSKKSKNNLPDQELNLEIFRMLEDRKKYFLTKVQPYNSSTTDNSIQDIKTYIDYSNAQLIAQYLASKRPFSQSFDKYLQKIMFVVQEPSIAIRTKAVKCLAMIVEVDPSVLLRKDMQLGVNQKFLDNSISVREAAVDLIGKYVLSSPNLIDQYYDMLSNRILDTGVSVRKRVIKILRDICIEYPDFDKIPEICVKMIRRVNDEDGIQKLVTEVFMRMWFTPCAENDTTSIERKINQMSDVVSMAHDTGTQWLDGLLKGVFTPKEDKDNPERNPNAPKKEPPKEVLKACQQLADGLVNGIIRYEGSDNKKALSCVTTLNLFAKVRPQLLVKHAITLEPYLNIKGNVKHIMKFISFIAEILEQVVPLMEHPSESFLAELETHLMILVISYNQSVVQSCLSCLGAVVNRITKNYKLIRDCFSKFYKSILSSRNQLQSEPSYPIENIFKPIFRRGLFTIGLIFRFFDFKEPEVYGHGLGPDAAALPSTICDEIFDHLLFFSSIQNNELRRETLIALGHFCIKNFEYLTNQSLRQFYCDLLISKEYSVEIKINVLRNILMYLNDADQSMEVKDKDWKTQSLVENLCDMGDVISGMSSRIIQLYLRDVLNSLMHPNLNVRLWSMKVVQAVLRQGLVHPVQIVPYLICLSTDTRREVAHRADHHLEEIDKKYPGFVNMKCHVGIKLSFELQQILQPEDKPKKLVRGYCIREKDNQPTALNGFLYSLLRSTKPQRRALVQSITKQFDETKNTLQHMLYLADNLAYFPYTVQDEPLYIIHQIDLMISCTGTGILQTYKDNLIPLPKQKDIDPNNKFNVLEDDDDDEDRDAILGRLPEDTTELQKSIISAQGCILLLLLKQHLKSCYKITEGKISRYSPSEVAKIYEKALHKQPVEPFNPKSILDIIHEQNNATDNPRELSDNSKKDLVDRYLEFKQLMLKFEKEESDNDSDKAISKSVTNTPIKNRNDSNLNASNDDAHVNNVNNVIPNTAAVPNKENSSNPQATIVTASPASTAIKPTRIAKQTTQQQQQQQQQQQRKQPSRGGKRKKRRVVSSSDESDFSDDDYV